MKRFILLLSLGFQIKAFAIEGFDCFGEWKNAEMTMQVKLRPESDLTEDIVSGVLPTVDGPFEFTVQKRRQDFYFRAEQKDPPSLWIGEYVPSLPNRKTRSLPRHKEVSVFCVESETLKF